MESRVTDVLKNLRDKKEISIEQYKDLSPSGSRPGIMYGLAKVHKIVRDGLPSFRSILSAIGTPTCKLAKFLVPILEPLTTNEYTIKDSFTFAEELQSFDSKLVMASFDIESQLTFVWKICFKIGLMSIICRKTLFVSYLLGLCLNH